jgi:hypothetical protein
MPKSAAVATLLLVGLAIWAQFLAPIAGPLIAIVAAMLAAGGCWLTMAPLTEAARKQALAIEHELEIAVQKVTRLSALEKNVTSLRHDLRGILSPALLTADRLLENDNPALRRVADVVIRTVERATARLAETKLGAVESAHKAAPLDRPDPPV